MSTPAVGRSTGGEVWEGGEACANCGRTVVAALCGAAELQAESAGWSANRCQDRGILLVGPSDVADKCGMVLYIGYNSGGAIHDYSAFLYCNMEGRTRSSRLQRASRQPRALQGPVLASSLMRSKRRPQHSASSNTFSVPTCSPRANRVSAPRPRVDSGAGHTCFVGAVEPGKALERCRWLESQPNQLCSSGIRSAVLGERK